MLLPYSILTTRYSFHEHLPSFCFVEWRKISWVILILVNFIGSTEIFLRYPATENRKFKNIDTFIHWERKFTSASHIFIWNVLTQRIPNIEWRALGRTILNMPNIFSFFRKYNFEKDTYSVLRTAIPNSKYYLTL